MSLEFIITLSIFIGIVIGSVTTYLFLQQREKEQSQKQKEANEPPTKDAQTEQPETNSPEKKLKGLPPDGFGPWLRFFRLKGGLTQERFAELLETEMGGVGFTGAAISSWERGRTSINVRDRRLLLSIVVVLIKQTTILTPAEADQLLTSGGYSALSQDEMRACFPNYMQSQKNSPH